MKFERKCAPLYYILCGKVYELGITCTAMGSGSHFSIIRVKNEKKVSKQSANYNYSYFFWTFVHACKIATQRAKELDYVNS